MYLSSFLSNYLNLRIYNLQDIVDCGQVVFIDAILLLCYSDCLKEKKNLYTTSDDKDFRQSVDFLYVFLGKINVLVNVWTCCVVLK